MKFNNLQAEHAYFETKIQRAVKKVMRSGKYLFGEQTEKLEYNFTALTGKKHAIAVKNATDAITMLTRYWAINYLEGDKMVTIPNFGAFPTRIAAVNGLMPIIGSSKNKLEDTIEYLKVDDTFTIDPNQSIYGDLIISVDLFGNESPMEEIRAKRKSAFIIQDCAQATDFNRDYSFADAVVFSFYPTKPLAAMGDGGMICTDNDDLADFIRKHRFYGYEHNGMIRDIGVNSRMDEIQAAILNVKFNELEDMNKTRRNIAKIYDKNMPFGIKPMRATYNCIYHQYPVQVIDKEHCEKLKLALTNAGIPYMVHYPRMVNELFTNDSHTMDNNKLSDRIISLPCYTFQTDAEIEKVVKFLQKFK